MLMSVRVCQTCLEQSIFIFLAQRALREQSSSQGEHSESTKRTLREHLESSQSIKIRVIQSEPKILRLVEIGE